MVTKGPAYYDGPLKILIKKDNKIARYKITRSGDKIRLHLYDFELFVSSYRTENFDPSELNNKLRKIYEFMAKCIIKNYESE